MASKKDGTYQKQQFAHFLHNLSLSNFFVYNLKQPIVEQAASQKWKDIIKKKNHTDDTKDGLYLMRNSPLIITSFLMFSCFARPRADHNHDAHVTIAHGHGAASDPNHHSEASGWVVRLKIKKDQKFFFCTGSLVKADIVLTVAHCLVDSKKKAVDPRSVEVILIRQGKDKFLTRSGTFLSIHSKFDPIILWNENSNKSYDLGWIKLNQPIDADLSGPLPQLALTSRELKDLGIPGGRVTFFGYGATEKGALSERLLYGVGLTYPWTKCAQEIEGQDLSYVNPCLGPERLFCLLQKRSESHTLPGDSGGPATVFRNGRHHIVGVLSGGNPMRKKQGPETDSVFETLDESSIVEWLPL